MKKIAILLLAFAVINSCKKESDDDDGGGSSPTPTVICNGNGSNEYFPMAQGNVWRYGTSSSDTTSDYQMVINGTQVYSTQTYNKFIKDDYFSSYTYQYFRTAGNGDVYEYRVPYNDEFLAVPANPVVNQTWMIGSDTMKVVSLTATITTPVCSYTGLLQINQIDELGTIVLKFYYKKGIGMVTRFYFVNENLVSITLN